MAAFEAWLVFLILVVNVVGELQRKRTLAASRGFLAAARLSCYLGSYLSRTGNCDKKCMIRIGKAASVFGRLVNIVIFNFFILTVFDIYSLFLFQCVFVVRCACQLHY